MSAFDNNVKSKFQEYCQFYSISNDSLKINVAFETFLRRYFVSLITASNTSFLQPSELLDATFSMCENMNIETFLPFYLIEDLIEIGSFEILKDLLPYLDLKAQAWNSVGLNSRIILN